MGIQTDKVVRVDPPGNWPDPPPQKVEIVASLEIPSRRNSLGNGRMDEITHERAQEAALRLIHSHFGTKPHAKIHIPVEQDDDDVVIMDYIQQQIAKELGLR